MPPNPFAGAAPNIGGAIVNAEQPSPIAQLLQAAGQFPQQQQQAKVNALQLQLGNQTLKNQQADYASAQQQQQMNAMTMAQQRAKIIGQQMLANPTMAFKPPPQLVSALQGIDQTLGTNFLKQNADGSYAVNTDAWKPSVSTLSPQQIEQLRALPKSERVTALQNMSGDEALKQQIINAPLTPTPEQQMAWAKAGAYVSEQYSLSEEHKATTYATLTKLPSEVQLNNARINEAVANANSASVRAQAAAQNAATAAQRLQIDTTKPMTQALDTAFRQNVLSAQTAISKAQGEAAGAARQLAGLAKQLGVDPKDPDFVNKMMNAAATLPAGSPMYSTVSKAVSAIAQSQSIIESAREQVNHATAYLATNPYLQQYGNSISKGVTSVQNIGKPKGGAALPGLTPYGTKNGKTVYTNSRGQYVYGDGSPVQ